MDSAVTGRSSIYQSLSPETREVRLVRVQHDESRRVKCSLEVHSLRSGIEFIALSYCWTREQATRRIEIHGKPFYIRPNLHEFLKLARNERQSSLMFIDAISINQDDEIEKSSQIGLMREVYHNAREVHAWLGIDCVDPQVPDYVVAKLEQLCDKEPRSIAAEEVQESMQCLQQTILKPGFWSRLWIVQEVLLARQLVFRFRKCRVDSDNLMKYLKDNKDLAEGSSQALSNYFAQPLWRRLLRTSASYDAVRRDHNAMHSQLAAYNMLERRKLYQDAGEEQPRIAFTEAVQITVAHQCSQSLDQIFGMLALTTSSIVPDYGMRVIDLLIRAFAEGVIDVDAQVASEKIWNDRKARLWAKQQIFPFGAALLHKLALSIWHTTTALIILEVLKSFGDADDDFVIYYEFVRSNPTFAFEIMRQPGYGYYLQCRCRSVILLLQQYRQWNSNMEAPKSAGEIARETQFKVNKFVCHRESLCHDQN